MSKFLDRIGKLQSDSVFNVIANLAKDHDLKFIKCESCEGTGLGNFHKNITGGGYNWDGMTFCNHCNGTGFTGWEQCDEFKLCVKCFGRGCKICGDKGYLDWVQVIRGRAY